MSQISSKGSSDAEGTLNANNRDESSEFFYFSVPHEEQRIRLCSSCPYAPMVYCRRRRRKLFKCAWLATLFLRVRSVAAKYFRIGVFMYMTSTWDRSKDTLHKCAGKPQQVIAGKFNSSSTFRTSHMGISRQSHSRSTRVQSQSAAETVLKLNHSEHWFVYPSKRP